MLLAVATCCQPLLFFARNARQPLLLACGIAFNPTHHADLVPYVNADVRVGWLRAWAGDEFRALVADSHDAAVRSTAVVSILPRHGRQTVHAHRLSHCGTAGCGLRIRSRL